MKVFAQSAVGPRSQRLEWDRVWLSHLMATTILPKLKLACMMSGFRDGYIDLWVPANNVARTQDEEGRELGTGLSK